MIKSIYLRKFTIPVPMPTGDEEDLYLPDIDFCGYFPVSGIPNIHIKSNDFLSFSIPDVPTNTYIRDTVNDHITQCYETAEKHIKDILDTGYNGMIYLFITPHFNEKTFTQTTIVSVCTESPNRLEPKLADMGIYHECHTDKLREAPKREGK